MKRKSSSFFSILEIHLADGLFLKLILRVSDWLMLIHFLFEAALYLGLALSYYQHSSEGQ